MDTKDAMKAVINASTARTATTLANTDLIQLYDNNGNPIYKISKSDFMSAVYNYLTSSSVAANLASVLGVPTIAGNNGAVYIESNDDLDNLTVSPCYRCNLASIVSTVTNMPSDALNNTGFVVLNIQPYGIATYSTQIFIQGGSIWSRFRTSSSWNTWKKFAFEQ